MAASVGQDKVHGLDLCRDLANGQAKAKTAWEANDSPVENFRRMKVIVIGAGYSGIYCGIRIPQRLKNIDLTIYEKNGGVGGTWWENRYPGCACDIPAHSYQYSFSPNPLWSAFYAPAAEIQAYLASIVEKYSVQRFIKCFHKVVDCKWDELLAKCYDFKSKRIGIIGGGSSAIQIIPELQKVPGAHLSCFVRSKTWISRPFGDSAVGKLGLDSLDFTTEQKLRFVHDPDHYARFREVVESEANSVHALTLKGSAMQNLMREDFTGYMKRRLAKKPEILETLLPSFSVGCRRLTPGPGYLEALVEDNVDFINTPIRRLSKSSVELTDGRLINLDVLVCATGFQASAPPPFPVTGRDGQTLSSKFDPYAETYLSLATDKFPNYFMMLGPNSAIGTGSLTMMIEMEGDYIIKAIRKMQKENIRSMEVKPQRVKDFSKIIDSYFTRTVYLEDCNSWYRSNGGSGDRITGLWPGSSLHAMETFRSPRWEDYDYVYEGEQGEDEVNQLRWLGNGWSSVQTDEKGGELTYYLKPGIMDIPTSPFPEDTKLYQMRSFSH